MKLRSILKYNEALPTQSDWFLGESPIEKDQYTVLKWYFVLKDEPWEYYKIYLTHTELLRLYNIRHSHLFKPRPTKLIDIITAILKTNQLNLSLPISAFNEKTSRTHAIAPATFPGLEKINRIHTCEYHTKPTPHIVVTCEVTTENNTQVLAALAITEVDVEFDPWKTFCKTYKIKRKNITQIFQGLKATIREAT